MKEQIANLLRVVEEEGASAALSKVLYDGNWQSSYKTDFLAITTLAGRITQSKSIPDKYQNCAGNFKLDGSITAIIGEKPSAQSPLKRSYPFGDTSGCSGWLNTLIIKGRIKEESLFWVNAINLDGSENDPSMINELKPKQIVCLGKVAEKWAKKNGWEFVSFPHPQYWKRFKSKEPYPLIEFLRRSTGEL